MAERSAVALVKADDPRNLIRVRPAKEGKWYSGFRIWDLRSQTLLWQGRFFMEPFDQRLKRAVVGIAGVGGLGSTVATALARTGIGCLILADFDNVEESNLNRQHYFIDQIGQPKVRAMAENLRRINPRVEVRTHQCCLDPAGIKALFAKAQVVAECFDKADQKQMLVETILAELPQVTVVAASGLAGYGKSNAIRTRRISQRLVIVGDHTSAVGKGLPLTAGRVWIAAAHQANAIVELLVEEIL